MKKEGREGKERKDLDFKTKVVHVGNGVDKETGVIKRPITMGNSYRLPYDPTDINWSSTDGNLYTRNGGSNQKYLENRLSSITNSEDTIAFASGVGALSALFFSMLTNKDHVIFSNITYIATYRLLNELFNNKFGVETTIIDTTNIKYVESAIRPNTKLIHIETPGNPIISISDISAIAKLAHEKGILLSVDNTLASPYNQKPLDLGADFSIESLTKYINGHGDSMGGSISGKKEYLDKIRQQAQLNIGAVISPFNAWLIMRGSTTLALRMEQHNKNGLKIAKYLETVDSIKFVSYPGLKSHVGHEIAKSQMSPGFGGVLSFALNGDQDTHNQFVDNLKLITSAVSLGHDESLIVFIGKDDERQYLYPKEFNNGFFRLSVGIEDVDDLINDINQALNSVGLF
ncbi:MAG: aminotransferase class I/II-fold pyridoxal phosphate-dependent enzyme [Methanobrevibacter sp.]|jgi:methionine-gamma-lyase|nr:aminotransferase class I/II-fold pyridoxal phosphate-dependent enzyme [Candidatus Methanovirga meridionalis]